MKRQANQRERLLEESARTCIYCGHPVTLENMEVDHIVPLSRGGSNGFENKVCSCPQCNAEKADKSVAEFVDGMSQRRRKAYYNRLETLYMQDKLSMEKWNLLDPLPAGTEEEPDRWEELEELDFLDFPESPAGPFRGPCICCPATVLWRMGCMPY